MIRANVVSPATCPLPVPAVILKGMADGPQIPSPPSSNVELKARLASLETAREIAGRLATGRLETEHQVDTYFRCQKGRLKLREISGRRAELIWYSRPDQQTPKTCDYVIVPVEDAASVKRALTATLGVRAVVDKHREIYLYHNVRIHLDRIAALGSFLEFEAVLGPDVDVQRGRDQLGWLRQQFGIRDDDLLTGSYADLGDAVQR
jgi:predicted adenylyl cyclase CyaB